MNGRSRIQLANLLARRFSMSELETLVFSLDGVDFEDLKGETKETKAVALVAYMERRDRIDDLLEQIKVNRPELSGQVDEIGKSLPRNGKVPIWAILSGGVILLLLLAFIGWRTGPETTPDKFAYQVKVQDAVSGAPVPQGVVTLATADDSVPDTQITDNNGVAVFQIPNSQAGSEAVLSVQKSGYRHFTQFITLESGQLPQIVLIEPDS